MNLDLLSEKHKFNYFNKFCYFNNTFSVIFFNVLFNFFTYFFFAYSKKRIQRKYSNIREVDKIISSNSYDDITKNNSQKNSPNYFSVSKIVNEKELHYSNNSLNFRIERPIEEKLESLIDKYEDVNIRVRERVEKIFDNVVWSKIAVWNCQRLNKIQTNERYVKLEFLRDILNENRFDFVYLVDIDDKNNVVNLNGFRKYNEGRNCLFIKANISNKFFVSKNILYDPISKIAFVYITPNINDKTFKENICWLLDNKFSLIGDFNIKSNKWLNKWIIRFDGEDSLQSGFLNFNLIKNVFNSAAPSDHRFICGFAKLRLFHSLNLKTKEISFEKTFENIKNITDGIVPKFEPRIVINKGFVNLNDRENTINFMIADFLNNNIRKIYKKYNYLWLGNKREPFLGTVVPIEVVNSFKEHYHNNEKKEFKDCKYFNENDIDIINKLIVKKTKSTAVNNEFMSLRNITDSINKIWNEDKADKLQILNNIIKIANEMKGSLNAQTFFLQKNHTLRSCNDVRVIVIVPGVLKIYESLIFDEVVDYISSILNQKVIYQFGGVRRGSCFAAMQTIRLKIEKFKSNSLVMLDLSKGYDSINFFHLEKFINKYIKDGRIKKFLKNWVVMAKNLNVIMNNIKIKKDRGIAMGLSLSPILFVFYVDIALKDISKDNLIMYMDDLTIVLEKNKGENYNYNLVNEVINTMKFYDLIINKKKTKLLSEDSDIISEFQNEFEVVNEDKFLGRKLMLNGDGFISADCRFYNLKGFRMRAIPYWTTFFVKRLIHSSALEARLRYKTFMWAVKETSTIDAIWRNNWSFFKSSMGKYSYTQMVFSVFNIFRYCVDTVDIIKWRQRINKKEDIKIIDQEVINKIKTGTIPQLNGVFNKLKIDWEIVADNEWTYTKKFLDNLWVQFQSKVLEEYIEIKKEKNIKIFPDIKKYVKNKLFNHFGCIQKVVFKHMAFKNRMKQLFINNVIKATGKFAKLIVTNFEKNMFLKFRTLDVIKLVEPIHPRYWELENIDNNAWEAIFEDECENLWDDINWIIKVTDLLKLKVIKNDNWKSQINDDARNVFIDGSYNQLTGEAGYGGVIYTDAINKIEIWGKVPDNIIARRLKNFAGELWGAMEVLKKVKELKIQKINLIFDFEGIKNYAYNIWYSTDRFIRDVYIPSINKLKSQIAINFIRISSHSGITDNDRADCLAKKAVNIEQKGKIVKKNNKHIKEEHHRWLSESYKIIFKVLTVGEMMLLNSNLNNLNPDELLFTLKIKLNSIDDLLENIWNLTQFEDVDPIDNVYYDLYVE